MMVLSMSTRQQAEVHHCHGLSILHAGCGSVYGVCSSLASAMTYNPLSLTRGQSGRGNSYRRCDERGLPHGKSVLLQFFFSFSRILHVRASTCRIFVGRVVLGAAALRAACECRQRRSVHNDPTVRQDHVYDSFSAASFVFVLRTLNSPTTRLYLPLHDVEVESA